MSKPKKKPEVRDLNSPILTQKQIKKAKEDRIQHRKTVAYTILGIVCAAAAAALLIWNSNFFQSRVTAVTIGDHNYTANDVNYYYQTTYYQYYMYAQYGMVDFDTSTKPADQTYDESTGETYEDYFIDTAIQTLTAHTAIYDAAVAAGFTITDETKAQIDSTISGLDTQAAEAGYTTASYLKAEYGTQMTLKVYRQILEREGLVQDYYSYYSDSLSYTDDQLQSYYDENAATLDTFVYNYAFISGAAATTDSSGSSTSATDEETAAALATAEATANTFNTRLAAGEDFSALATELLGSSDSSKVNATGTGSTLSSTYSSFLTDSTVTAGASEVVENSSSDGYYVVQFLNRYLDTSKTADARMIFVKAETDSDSSSSSSSTTTTTTPTADQMAAAQSSAEALLSQWTAGEATQTSFETLATSSSADSSTASNGGAYDNIYNGQYTSTMSSDVNTWLFSADRAAGDTTILPVTSSSYYGYMIIYYVGQDEPYWKYTATSSLRSTDTSTWESGLEANYTATRGDGMKYVL